MKESRLDDKIREFCASRNAVARKTHGSVLQKDRPDWIICYKGYYIAMESKAADGRLSPGQKRELLAIRRSGGIAEVIYNVSLLQEVFETIDRGEQWTNKTDLQLK